MASTSLNVPHFQAAFRKAVTKRKRSKTSRKRSSDGSVRRIKKGFITATAREPNDRDLSPMKLDDCHTQIRAVVAAPFEHSEPSDDWCEARAEGHIPSELWDLYRATRYLSASALAGFDTPEARIVTVYFSRLMRSSKRVPAGRRGIACSN